MNVYILLDRSGSMSNLWNEAVGSINAYVEKLKAGTKVYLAAFDSGGYDVLREEKAGDWKAVKNNELSPRGMTPLYDSCAKTMAKAEADNSKKTILVVMTDGFENNSVEYNQAAIKAKVKDWENRKWEVIFLGANFDAVESVSSSVGVMSNKTLNYGLGNFVRGMDALASSTNAYHDKGTAMNFTVEVKAEVAKAAAK